MPRVTFFVFLTALVLPSSVHSLRDSDDESGGVRMSVGPRSFQLAGVKDHNPHRADALTQLHDEHKMQPEKDLDRPAEEKKGRESETGSASEIASKEALEHAKVQLDEVARERQSVEANAERLDKQMNAQYEEMLKDDEAETVQSDASLVSISETESPGKPKQTEDEQFDALEEQTSHIMEWFKKLKDLKKKRDKLKEQKDAAVKTASNLGMSPADIAKQILHESLTDTAKSGDKPKHSGLLEKRQQLASVMASSAIEMAQMESAAGEVVAGIDRYTTWKKRNDDSQESQVEAVEVKAKLDAAMQFLAEHENTIDRRKEQLDGLMMQAGVM